MAFSVAQVLLSCGVVVLSLLLVSYFSSGKSTGKSEKKTLAAEKAPAKTLVVAGPYTKEEISQHNKRDDVWIIVDDKVYDVTGYVDDHPGGDAILTHAGGDATVGVHGPQHPASMWDVLALYFIGDLKKD